MAAESVQSRFTTKTWDKTPTAEALLWASAQMANVREERKVILLITDGKPSDMKKTKDVLAFIRHKQPDVEIMGIGIEVEDIKNWLPHSKVLRDIESLPQVVLGLVTGILTNKRVAA
jgi:Mg-chelatase subunit ChlD